MFVFFSLHRALTVLIKIQDFTDEIMAFMPEPRITSKPLPQRRDGRLFLDYIVLFFFKVLTDIICSMQQKCIHSKYISYMSNCALHTHMHINGK